MKVGKVRVVVLLRLGSSGRFMTKAWVYTPKMEKVS